jgi:hypothetical protein
MFGTREVEATPLQVTTPWITRDAVKALLGITGADSDTRVDTLLAVACANVEKYIGGYVFQRTVTERMYPEDPVGVLTVSHYPIIDLTSLHVDEVAETLSGYFITKSGGMIRSKDGTALSGQRIDAVYTAGYAPGTYPPDIVEATLQHCKDIYNSSTLDGAVSKESVPDVGSVEYRGGETYYRSNGVAVSVHVAALLAPFVRRGV